MPDIETVQRYYDANVQHEWERLERHPMEFAITSHYLKRYIRPGMRVLDVGGGPGRYSMMLAGRGCDVTLLDLSPGNASFALEKAGEMGLKLAALAGDAREADKLVTGPFDAVLNMGPLYHLLTVDDRSRSVQACRNLLREGGVMFASIITQHAGILYYLANGLDLIMLPQEQEYLRQVELDTPFSGMAFTEAHFMRVWDLCPFMEKQGFKTLHRVSCEGLCTVREKEYITAQPEVQKRWLDLSIALCERPEFLGLAEHVLYVGRI